MSWFTKLSKEIAGMNLAERFEEERKAGRPVYPSTDFDTIFKAFHLTPLEKVRVVIIGQDPYPRPQHPTGVCFGIPAEEVSNGLPSSLRNIEKELAESGYELNDHSLYSWAEQGVLLLNSRLTVGDRPKSHFHWGWEKVTGRALELVDEYGEEVVFMEWGREARLLARKHTYNNPRNYHLTTSHPCEHSAHLGFKGSGIFTKCNMLLVSSGSDPIDWGAS